MKKTVLGIGIAIMLLVVMLSTSVNAASLSADKIKMEKGQTVTVTVTTDEEVESMQFDLKFDTTKYKFVEDSIKTDLKAVDYNIEGDTITVSAFDAKVKTKTLTLEFEAIENGENVPFEISGTEFSNDETMTNAKVEVTIAEPEKPVDPEEKPEDKPEEKPDNKPEEKPEDKPSTDDKTEVDNSDKYVDEDGKEITKLPQAGSLVPSIALGIAVLGLATVTGYKMIKNK